MSTLSAPEKSSAKHCSTWLRFLLSLSLPLSCSSLGAGSYHPQVSLGRVGHHPRQRGRKKGVTDSVKVEQPLGRRPPGEVGRAPGFALLGPGSSTRGQGGRGHVWSRSPPCEGGWRASARPRRLQGRSCVPGGDLQSAGSSTPGPEAVDPDSGLTPALDSRWPDRPRTDLSDTPRFRPGLGSLRCGPSRGAQTVCA